MTAIDHEADPTTEPGFTALLLEPQLPRLVIDFVQSYDPSIQARVAEYIDAYSDVAEAVPDLPGAREYLEAKARIAQHAQVADAKIAACESDVRRFEAAHAAEEGDLLAPDLVARLSHADGQLAAARTALAAATAARAALSPLLERLRPAAEDAVRRLARDRCSEHQRELLRRRAAAAQAVADVAAAELEELLCVTRALTVVAGRKVTAFADNCVKALLAPESFPN